jgi:2,3-bisphosphoglycerate-independent phosphoglycerate mutase
MKPIVVANENDEPLTTIENGDVVICFNFRTDRLRQTTIAFTQKDLPDYGMETMDLEWYTMTNYNSDFKDVNVIFDKDNVSETMGEVTSKAGLKQIRIAETEKYPHVTFFFSGGREKPFKGEKRIMCSSPKVATYDMQPEMSANEIVEKIIPEIKSQSADFICLNFANPDMVGHTGDFQAAIKAVEAVDKCTREVVDAAVENDYSVLVIADHVNSEMMINPDGSANTAHTTNPVPLILVDKGVKTIESGNLGDIAPTILKLMGITKPELMTQNPLI